MTHDVFSRAAAALRWALPAAVALLGGAGLQSVLAPPSGATGGQAGGGPPLAYFDFEGPYLLDPGYTIRDHSLVFYEGLWHCFYIRGIPGQGTAAEIEFGHAISENLRNWTRLLPALSAGPASWDQRSIWAPMVLAQHPASPTKSLMIYTGADMSVNQRMGFATTSDKSLSTWSKSPSNPILSPNPATWAWDDQGSFSAFRDPFYFFYNGQHHLLHTAKVPDGGTTRGAIHHAVSSNFVSWSDAGPLFVHNGDFSVSWHELESVQLHQVGSFWFLFFSESAEVGTRLLTSTSMDSGWDINEVDTIDDGFAPEVTPLTGDKFLFSRHAETMADGESFWSIRVDSLRLDGEFAIAQKKLTDPLALDWPVRTGIAFTSAPTFGDNSALPPRNDPALTVGHGYISSREFYKGPLSGSGGPGFDLGVNPTGTMKSRSFPVQGASMSLRVGGSNDPQCFVALCDAETDAILEQAFGNGPAAMLEVQWDLTPYVGQNVYIWIEDASTQGYINVDEIEERTGSIVSTPPADRGGRARLLANTPNPFNPATTFRFELEEAAVASLHVLDARGREIDAVPPRSLPPGLHRHVWRGTDHRGQPVASGVYTVVLRAGGSPVDQRPVTLVR